MLVICLHQQMVIAIMQYLSTINPSVFPILTIQFMQIYEDQASGHGKCHY